MTTPDDSQQSTETVLTNPPSSARLVLVLGVLAGIVGGTTTALLSPKQLTLASEVYRTAGEAFLAGEDIYAVTPPDLPDYHYIYPPIVVVLFVPHALLGTTAGAYALQTLLNACAAGGIAVVLSRALARRGVALNRLDYAVLAAFSFCSSYSAITVVNGQVTLWLALAFAIGLDALDRNQEQLAGTAFAAAAAVKVFPAVIGLWLLRQRAWRGVAVALVTGVCTIVLGVLVLGPETAITYFTEVLTGRYDGFGGDPDPGQTRAGLQRQFAALFGLEGPVLTLCAFAFITPIVSLLYRRVDTDLRRQATVLGTIIATLLFFPLQRLYMPLFIFPLVILLYQLPPGRIRRVFVGGSLVSFVRVEYEFLATTIESLGLPAAIETQLLDLIAATLRLVLPPTLGMWLLLCGCLLVHASEPGQANTESAPVQANTASGQANTASPPGQTGTDDETRAKNSV